MKGTKREAPDLDPAKKLGTLISQSFPKMIHLYSFKKSGISRSTPLDNRDSIFNHQSNKWKSLIGFVKQLEPELDICLIEDSQFIYVNTIFNTLTKVEEFCESTNKRMKPMKRRAKNIDLQKWLPHTDIQDQRYVSDERIRLHNNILKGNFSDEKRRKIYIHSVDSLCCVKVVHEGDGKTTYTGSCYDFRQTGFCVHAAFVKYGEELKDDHKKLPID